MILICLSLFQIQNTGSPHELPRSQAHLEALAAAEKFQKWVEGASHAELDALLTNEREQEVVKRRDQIVKRMRKEKLDGYIDGITFEEGRKMTVSYVRRFDLSSANNTCGRFLSQLVQERKIVPKDFLWKKLYTFGFPEEEKEILLRKLDPNIIDFINNHELAFSPHWAAYVGSKMYLDDALADLSDEGRYAVIRCSLIFNISSSSTFGRDK